MDLAEAVRHAIDGNAILFLGAGFSCGGENLNGESLPSASELSRRMCKKMGILESTELAVVSEMFIDHPTYGKGITELIDFLKNQCICRSVSDEQKTIINLPWRRIYTTNYDNIPEICSRKVGRERETITATLPRKNVSFSKGAIVHLNGYIQGVTVDKFYEEVKITNSSYLKSGFLESNWAGQFVGDINKCKAIIFVGYSMKYDLELQKIMHEKIREKAIFIDQNEISEEQKYIFSKSGEFYPIEVKGFAEEIRKISEKYSAPEFTRGVISLEELDLEKYKIEKVIPNDVINLLVYGKCDKYDFKKVDYYLERRELLKKIKDDIKKSKICLIHAHFGNGKSIAQLYLASRLIDDYRVYLLNDLENIQEDIEILKNRKSCVNLIIVDDYDMQMKIFRELSYDFPDNIKVIATCRTTMSDVLLDKLISSYGILYDDICVENIEIITDDERKELIRLLDKYNLWGSKSSYSKDQKDELIKNKYRNRLSNIFYMLLDSKVILDKVRRIMSVANNAEIKKFLFAQAVCDIGNFKLRGYEIAFISGANYSEIEKASLNKDFKEIFVRTAEDVEIRSSIFYQYMIREKNDYNLLSSILNYMYIHSYNLGSVESDIVRKKLISRSTLIEIFGGNKNNKEWRQRDKEIYNFYSDIQNYAKSNPFFWLQYAITALNLGYYTDAKIYFDNAYSYAGELEGFDSFQLDTHYARFLLDKMLRDNEKFDFQVFTKAHRLLMDSSNAEIRLSYVLRQVGVYGRINKKYKENLSASNRVEFIENVKEVVLKFEEYFLAVEKKKKINFYFAIDKSVRNPFKEFRELLFDVFPIDEIVKLDRRYNRLVSKIDKVKEGRRVYKYVNNSNFI